MTNTKQDLRQISSKTLESRELGLTENFLLSNLVDNINLDLDFPLKISASFPTADSKINFSDSKIVAADNTTSVVLPVQNQIFTDLSSLWIDFQAQTVSSPLDFEITWPASNTVGYYRIAAFTLVGGGKISAIFSDESSSITGGSLANPGTFFVSSGLPLGYVILQCTDSGGKFKTADSASNIIENSKVFRFDSRSGGGGEDGGEVNNAVNIGSGEGFYKEKLGVDLRFKSLVAAGSAAITSSADTISISTETVEVNTASNTGSGVGLFKEKSASDLRFKSLLAGSAVTITTPSADTIALSIPFGETNTASNTGSGIGIFRQKIGANLEFKSLVAGSGFLIEDLTSSVRLTTASGESNTASNIGTGKQFFKTKSGTDLQFRSVIAGPEINISSASNELTINEVAVANPYVIGDIVESSVNYAAFQASKPDGSTWVPLDGRDITGSDLHNSGNVAGGFLSISSMITKILNSPNEDINDFFGYSVAISGDYIVVGAPLDDGSTDALAQAGEAYVFKKNSGGPDNWGLIKTLNSPNEDADDRFGRSVAISGDYIVVSASEDGGSTDAISSAGEAYVFKKDEGGPDNWGWIKTLNSPNEDAYDRFGHSIAISGDYIIVGANQDYGSTDAIYFAGEAYIFKKNYGGPDNWGLIKILNLPSETTSSFFGYSVAISSDYILISYETGIDSEINIFKKDDGGPDNWGLIKTLTSPNPDLYDGFGQFIAISGDYIVVGAYSDDGSTDTISNAGEAYVFKKNSGGPDNWGLIKTLNSPNEDANDLFGYSVAISGDYIVVGALGDGGSTDAISSAGEAYVFKKDEGGPDNWGWIKTLNSPNEDDDGFGRSVAISGDYIVVGASNDDGSTDAITDTGEAYVFKNFDPTIIGIPSVLPTEPNKYIKINN